MIEHPIVTIEEERWAINAFRDSIAHLLRGRHGDACGICKRGIDFDGEDHRFWDIDHRVPLRVRWGGARRGPASPIEELQLVHRCCHYLKSADERVQARNQA